MVKKKEEMREKEKLNKKVVEEEKLELCVKQRTIRCQEDQQLHKPPLAWEMPPSRVRKAFLWSAEIWSNQHGHITMDCVTVATGWGLRT